MNQKHNRAVAPEKHAFVCHGGVKVRTLLELKEQINLMNNSEFSHFVHGSQNHFANWIEDVLGFEDIANALRNFHSKSQMVAVLTAATAHEGLFVQDKKLKKAESEKVETKKSTSLAEKTKDIHKRINHLHKNLSHMTKYDTHTPKHTESSYEPVSTELRSKLIDFAFGLLIGLIIGILVGRTIGAF